MKKNLVIVCTHGDEEIGLNAVRELKDKLNFDVLIGNHIALKKHVRFIDADLNAVAPGNLKSKHYEERRAVQIIKKGLKYEHVLDIHGTVAKSGIFTIIPKMTKENVIFALQLPINNIVIIEDEKEDKGSITKFFKRGLGIEIGPKNNKKSLLGTIKKLNIINKDLPYYKYELDKTGVNTLIKKKNFYFMYGILDPKNIVNPKNKMMDFVLYKNGKESFYPIIPGEYNKKYYYKARKIKKNQITKILNSTL